MIWLNIEDEITNKTFLAKFSRKISLIQKLNRGFYIKLI